MKIVLTGREAGVEVKAPFRERPTGVWHGDDADKITRCLRSANRQFDDNKPNLLVIVPNLRTRMFANRHDLVKAAFGEAVMRFDLNADEGRLENQRLDFSPHGSFLKATRSGGEPLKDDGYPAFRRVSAIICIEQKYIDKHPLPDPLQLVEHKERMAELWPVWSRRRDFHFSRDNEVLLDHSVLVLHNPCAYHPISPEPWKEFPQLVCDDGCMRWTDDHEMV